MRRRPAWAPSPQVAPLPLLQVPLTDELAGVAQDFTNLPTVDCARRISLSLFTTHY